jgi:uncharacterized protein YjbI with pentapeptide repeats
MGTGAYLKITNNRSTAVTVTVTDVNCMYYDDAGNGSNLSLFNNATIPAGEALPSGSPQYIESDSSGECALETTTFYLTFKDPAGNIIGSKFNLSESDQTWQDWNNVDENFFSVTVTPSGNQFQISIDVLVDPFPAGPVINQWVLSAQNRAADIWYNKDFTVYGLNTTAGAPVPGSSNLVSLHDQENGTLALECGQNYNAYASVRDDYNYQVGFQFVNYPDKAGWITQIRDNEILQAIPTGDGYFALYSPHFSRYIQINPQRNSSANCNALMATGTDIGSAARFSAAGQQHNSVLDLVQIGKSAVGMSFAGVDLTGQNLSGANLTGCDFTQAISVGACTFTGATLTNAKFGAATLDLVKLAGADCTGADFTGAVLTASATPASPPVLSGATLKSAQIQGSLAGANLSGATLDSATIESSLAGAKMARTNLAGAGIKSAADLTGADLTGADLTGALLAGNLSNANLTGATLNFAVPDGGNLTNANLTGASLAGVNLAAQPALKLTGANLSAADLSLAVLPGADLSGTNLAGTNFTGQDLSQVKFSSPLQQSTDPDHPTIFTNCTLPYAVIGLNWSCLDLTGTNITGVPTNLAGLKASGVRRPQAIFTGATLDGATFAGASLDGAQFTSASLRGQVNFREALLVGAVFTQAVLDQASFQAAALGGVQLSQAATFSYAYLSNCDFTQASLYGVNFAGATLVSANILQAGAAPGLQEADFSNAYLPDADFTGASLQGAKFDGAFMVSCVLNNADLSPAQQGAISASLAGACLQGAAFDGTNLAGANLDNAAITNTRGMITQQYYGEDHQLTTPTEMRYQASDFPAATSFSNETMCPNGSTYADNMNAKLTITQMMAAPNPPTSWAPRNLEQERAPGPRAADE